MLSVSMLESGCTHKTYCAAFVESMSSILTGVLELGELPGTLPFILDTEGDSNSFRLGPALRFSLAVPGVFGTSPSSLFNQVSLLYFE